MDRQAAGMTWAEGEVSPEVELIWVSRQVAEISLEVRWCYQRLRRFDFSLEVFYRERPHDTSPEDSNQSYQHNGFRVVVPSAAEAPRVVP